MKSRKIIRLLGGLALFASSLTPAFAQERPAGWEDYSHSNETDPDYEIVFPQDEVNTLTITISPDNWAAMQANMTDLYGEFGSRPIMGGGFPAGDLPEGFEPPAGFVPGNPPENFQPGDLPEGFEPPGDVMMGPGGGGMLGIEENPMWVTADIRFNDQTWTNVGMRFKGNSSLMSGWGSGILKLGFKLDFDQFEDEYPEIDNQRFFGFKQLTFSSNWNDDSLLKEKVVADVFREAGVPAAQTAFYAVYVDYGAGPVYFGLYTAVEAVEDTVIETQFEDDNGNLYKPEGDGATFAAGTFDEASFDKETNEEEANYSDILALFEALHAETRTTDPATWRSSLEAVFDVDGFIRWLAVNEVIQNWDSYGTMAHNYYLYNDPVTGQLTWIPWDHNLALSNEMGGRRMGMGSGPDTLDQTNVSDNWPLISFLMADPVYHDLYVQYVDETINGAFEPGKMAATYQALHDLITPYVVGENGEIEGYSFLSSPEAFENSVVVLAEHAIQRYAEAQTFLSTAQAAQ